MYGLCYSVISVRLIFRIFSVFLLSLVVTIILLVLLNSTCSGSGYSCLAALWLGLPFALAQIIVLSIYLYALLFKHRYTSTYFSNKALIIYLSVLLLILVILFWGDKLESNIITPPVKENEAINF